MGNIYKIFFYFPGIKFGVAEYEDGPTGCTVIYFEEALAGKMKGATFYGDVRGGSVGSIHTEVGYANGFCFGGGSHFGLEATFGVSDYFHEKTNFSNS